MIVFSKVIIFYLGMAVRFSVTFSLFVFWSIFGLFWVHFWPISGLFWAYFGLILGQYST